MGVVDDLRRTNKGQLQYSRDLNPELVQRLTDEVSAPPKLYIYHHESPTYRSENKPVDGLQPSQDEKKDKEKDDDEDIKHSEPVNVHVNEKTETPKREHDKSQPTVYRSPAVSPEYGRTCLEIRNYEVMWDNKAKSSVEAKLQEYADKDRELNTMVEQKANELEEKQQMEMRKLFEQTSKLQLKEKNETSRRIQQMKDIHRTRKKLQDDMLLEGERKKQQLQEEERRRNEMEKRHASVQQHYSKVKETHDRLMSEYNSCTHKQHIPETGHKPIQMSGQILAKAEMTTKKTDLTPEDVQAMKNLLEYAKNTYDFMHAHIEEANKKAEAEEAERAKQQQLQEQQKAAAEKAQASTASAAQTAQGETSPASGAVGRRLSVIDEVVTEYEDYKAKLDNMQKLLAPFMANVEKKKYRFELQKAVNTPINAISPVDGAHLRDKLQKLIHLLAGHPIEGKHVSAKDAPEGITFCKNLIARMFVKKGEEQVSSKHESAFAIAMVAAGLWHEHSDLGDLMMAHFHSFCPYIVPLYFPRGENMSTQEYHKLLGYKIEDNGTIEPQDKFLKRMSGLMRLYAAILVSSPPRANCVHPHGIEYAWVWLARVLNMDPLPDISATLTYDMLQVTGHTLYNTYKVQFVKLLYMLYKDFLPKLKQVSVAGGPVARLELFLTQTLKNFKMKQSMSPPDGYLPQNFWFT